MDFEEKSGLRALFEYKDYTLQSGYSEEQLAVANSSQDKRRKFLKGYSVVNEQKVVPYEQVKTEESMQSESKKKAEHIREHRNFDASNNSMEKVIHATDNESAMNIVNNLKVNKNELRDAKGNKVIKMPWTKDEDHDTREAYIIYKGLRKKYMTAEEEAKEKHDRE